MSVGQRIRDRRMELHMTVDELAKKLNKNRATIYRYEKGEIENLPIDILEPLSEALLTTPQYLMGWDQKELIGTYIKEGEKESIYLAFNATNVKHVERWHKEFGLEPFTDKEHEKLIEYAKFLVSQRDK